MREQETVNQVWHHMQCHTIITPSIQHGLDKHTLFISEMQWMCSSSFLLASRIAVATPGLVDKSNWMTVRYTEIWVSMIIQSVVRLLTLGVVSYRLQSPWQPAHSLMGEWVQNPSTSANELKKLRSERCHCVVGEERRESGKPQMIWLGTGWSRSGQ